MVKSEVEREIFALVLITIIIVSLLGTWAIIRVIDERQVKTVDHFNDQGTYVSLVILPSPNQQQQPKQQGGSS